MKIERVVAMYFSATGTTRKVAAFIADKIAESLGAEYEEYGFTKPGRRIDPPSFGKSDLVVFGTPVYAGRVPNVLIKYIGEVRFDGSIVVPVVLFGNRNFDDALKELSNTLKNGGGVIAGAGAFVGGHAFSTVLGKGRPDAEDMAIAETFATDIADKVRACSDTGEMDVSERVPGEEPLRPYYKPRDSEGTFIDIRKVTPETSSSCDGCGICAEVCPMGSIDPLHVARITGICIKCCACVKRCPRGAKYFDDEGFLYHKSELEKMYARRAEPVTIV